MTIDRHFATFVLMMIIGTPSPGQASTTPDAAADPLSYLAAAKLASGGPAWDRLNSIHQIASVRQGGEDGILDTFTDLKHLRTLQRMELGAAVDRRGWDGVAGWSTSGSGLVQPGTSDESIAASVAMSYRAAYAFFWPERWPARFEYVGKQEQGKHAYDVLRISPAKADPFELWIDHDTHLIAQEITIGGGQPSTSSFDDYRRVQGVLLPFSQRDSIGEPEFDAVYATRSAIFGDTLGAGTFSPPAPPVEPDPFPEGRDSVTLPMEFIDNHIYIKARINEGPPQTFIFDTGATTMLGKSQALAMGLQPEGSLAGTGLGAATVEFNNARVRSIDIGGLKLPGHQVRTLDITDLQKSLDVDFVGFLGLELAQRAVVRIDYAGQLFTLIKPSAFKPSSSAIAIPLMFDEHMPVVDATIDGIAGQFQVDTGASQPLTLMTPFVAQHRLTAKYNTRRSQSGGAGGDTSDALARTGELRIGSVLIQNPVTTLKLGTRGVEASTWIAGNIGSGMLRRFTATFDYPHQMLYLEPNPNFLAPDVYDRSGLRMRRDVDGSALIVFVMPGSGAELAGIMKGDRILAVDGAGIHSLPLPSLRKLFKGVAGAEIRLSISSQAGEPREVKLRLSELI